MYRNAFTLRRAPFLLSYAVYSSVTVILHHEQHDRGQKYTDTLSFFWTCLHELQRGCNFGLKKPLGILQDMVNELSVSITTEGGDVAASSTQQLLRPSLDQSLFSTELSIMSEAGGHDSVSSAMMSQPANPVHVTSNDCYDNGNFFLPDYPIDGMDSTYGSVMPVSGLDFMNDQEKDMSHDALYGLFAPTQHYA